jgi:hypothetical protein
MYAVVAVFMFFGVILFTAAIIGESNNSDNTNPRNGRVELPGYDNYKFCDGNNLVYHIEDGGGSVIADSPECTQ